LLFLELCLMCDKLDIGQRRQMADMRSIVISCFADRASYYISTVKPS
jgi:hypothetical protein